MKLFHKIYMQVFLGMTVLAVGILLLLYSAMLRQSLSDTKNYGIEAFKNNISSLREYVQRETNGQVEKVVAEAVLIRAFLIFSEIRVCCGERKGSAEHLSI